MCFSATASFTASAILGTTGVACLIKNKKREAWLYATIPLLFSIQQAIEGFQWLSLQNGSANIYLGYGFLFFAYLLWPIYVPLAVSLLEKKTTHKQVQKILLLLGFFISLILFSQLLRTQSQIFIDCNHIVYRGLSALHPSVLLFYVLATCGSAIISTRPWVRIFGITSFLSLLVTFFVAQIAFVSVWCFFGALLSVLILIHVQSKNK